MPKPLEPPLVGEGDAEEKTTRRHEPPWPLMALLGTLMPGSHRALEGTRVSQVSKARLREVQGGGTKLHSLTLFKFKLKPGLLVLSLSLKQERFH